MVWTYSLTSLATTQKDQVRLAIGDTLSSDQQLQDEEINAALANRSTILGAAADCCRSIAAKFSRSVTQKAAGASANFSDLAKQYLTMALQFDAQAALSGSALPYAGGISIADKMNQETNSDRVPPNFTIGMDDNVLPVPEVGPEGETEEFDNS